MCNTKHHYAIHLKFGDQSLNPLTKLVLETETSICSTIKENLLLYYRKFLVFVVVVTIKHIFIPRPVSRRNTAFDRNH